MSESPGTSPSATGAILALPSKYRRPPQPWRFITVLFAGIALLENIMYVFHIRPFGFMLMDVAYLYLLFALLLPLVFLWVPASKRAPRDRVPWYDILLAGTTFVVLMYASFNAVDIVMEGWAGFAPPGAFVLALVLWPILVEIARRSAGVPFAIVVGLLSIYPLFAGFAPGVFQSQNFSLARVANFHIYGEDSFLGIPAAVMGRLVIGFLFFALSLQVCGAGKFFNEFAIALVGRVRGGNAKVAIVASGLFGSISGVTSSNVFTTGSFTIPAMKKDGFSPEFAGAVEAVASSGGCIMPPVMGAVAFVMAEFMGVPYATIALAAVIPALLYYWTLFMQIDSHSAKAHFAKQSVIMETRPIPQILLTNFHIIVCFGVLVYVLFYLRLAAWAPWIASALLFILAAFRRETRIGPRGFVRLVESAGRTLGDLAGILGPIGMVIGSMVLTGIAFSLPFIIVELAGGNVYLLLVFGFMAAFFLGMGVTIIACYLFTAIVVAPGLVMGGFDQLAVHLFVLYAAMTSYITPPVCIAAFQASIIAGSSPVKTGYKAMRLGFAIYIVPFFFVLNPALILRGTPLEILQAAGACFLGMALIAGGLEGWLWRVGAIRIPIRILLFVAGVLIAYPETLTDIWGLALAGVVLGFCFLRRSWAVVSPETQRSEIRTEDGKGGEQAT